MALVVFVMIFVLRFTNHTLNIKKVFAGACDRKMLLNIICIFYFIQILTDTGILHLIVSEFQKSPLPVPAIVAAVSFIIGILTGMSQGHVAIVMPIIAAMAPGDFNACRHCHGVWSCRADAYTDAYVPACNARLF